PFPPNSLLTIAHCLLAQQNLGQKHVCLEHNSPSSRCSSSNPLGKRQNPGQGASHLARHLGYVLEDEFIVNFAKKHGTLDTFPDGSVNISRIKKNFLSDIKVKSGIFVRLVYLKDRSKRTGEISFLRIASSRHPRDATRERAQKLKDAMEVPDDPQWRPSS
ncbi:hypothetical protein BJ138DRAFT_154362, partial [Hygrophoropsis aurantiaca]